MKLSIPPLTRACLITFLLLSLMVTGLRYSTYAKLYHQATTDDGTQVGAYKTALPRFEDTYVPYLTLVPAISIIYPWTVFLSAFVEQSVIGAVVAGTSFALCGKYLERVWSSRQLAIFLGIQAVIPNAVTALLFALLYGFTRNEQWLLNVVSGGSAIQAGFLVAFKQLVPEHAIVLFQGAIRIHVKHLVIPILIGYSTLGLIVRHPVMVFLPWVGFLTSWVYLRFYKVSFTESLLPMSSSLTSGESEQTKIRGDASDTFALADFFYPDPVKQAVALVSNSVFSALVTLKVCTPFNQDEVEASNIRAQARTGGNGNGQAGDSSTDADRRRALALKVLEERLQK